MRLGALVAPASTHENRTTELILKHLAVQAVTGRLEVVRRERPVAERREMGHTD